MEEKTNNKKDIKNEIEQKAEIKQEEKQNTTVTTPNNNENDKRKENKNLEVIENRKENSSEIENIQKEKPKTNFSNKEKKIKKEKEEPKNEVVENYVADIFNTPYAKQSIKSAVKNTKDLEETTEFTETIVSEEIKEKLEEMKNRQLKLKENPDTITPPKKNHLPTIILLLIIFVLSSFIIYHFTTYNHKIKEKIVIKEKVVKTVDDNYVFLGDSITEKYDLNKYFKKRNKNIINSGNSGNLTKDILNNMKKRVYNYNPSVVFLLIGVNDVNKDVDPNEIIDNIKKIVMNIKENRSLATIYVESIYPTGNKERNDIITKVNNEVEKFCKKEKITYIDIYKDLINDDKVIDGKYTKDGLHLNEEGYNLVTKKIEKYIKEEK